MSEEKMNEVPVAKNLAELLSDKKRPYNLTIKTADTEYDGRKIRHVGDDHLILDLSGDYEEHLKNPKYSGTVIPFSAIVMIDLYT